MLMVPCLSSFFKSVFSTQQKLFQGGRPDKWLEVRNPLKIQTKKEVRFLLLNYCSLGAGFNMFLFSSLQMKTVTNFVKQRSLVGRCPMRWLFFAHTQDHMDWLGCSWFGCDMGGIGERWLRFLVSFVHTKFHLLFMGRNTSDRWLRLKQQGMAFWPSIPSIRYIYVYIYNMSFVYTYIIYTGSTGFSGTQRHYMLSHTLLSACIYIYMLAPPPPRSTFSILLSAQSSTRKLFAQLKRKTKKTRNNQKKEKTKKQKKNWGKCLSQSVLGYFFFLLLFFFFWGGGCFRFVRFTVASGIFLKKNTFHYRPLVFTISLRKRLFPKYFRQFILNFFL